MHYLLILLGIGGVLLLSKKANSDEISTQEIIETGSLPLGIRQNNPGNLRPNGRDVWNGQTGTNNGYLVFQTIEYGIRAAFINLRTYFKNDYNTIHEIINRWAPKADKNHTDAYIAYVSQRTGIDKHSELVFNKDVAQKLLEAMFFFENGQDVSSSTVTAGIELA